MKIAIHTADLDHDRIDGTRVYMLNMLKNFGKISPTDEFLLYHKGKFNPALTPPTFSNYRVKRLPFPFFWTQTRFAWSLFWDKPEVLWMPVHNVPLFKWKGMRTVVTIHDLAFKRFPHYFPVKDLKRLNLLTGNAVKFSDRIIAISESTKRDLLEFYPELKAEKISVVPHGFDRELFAQRKTVAEADPILKNYNLEAKNYLLYVGAIQPRKNLVVLIEAFTKIKETYPGLKLVLAGAPAWKHEATYAAIEQSKFREDIIVTGTVPFEHQAVLYQNSAVFVWPSLYEGFGIPILEAFASGVPVVAAKNSSLPEVAGDAALLFETDSVQDLTEKLQAVLGNEELRTELIEKGFNREKQFSWEKCAQETLDIILKW